MISSTQEFDRPLLSNIGPCLQWMLVLVRWFWRSYSWTCLLMSQIKYPFYNIEKWTIWQQIESKTREEPTLLASNFEVLSWKTKENSMSRLKASKSTQNKEDPMNNDKAKNVKRGSRKLKKLRIRKPHSANKYMKLV